MSTVVLLKESKEVRYYEDRPDYWDLRAQKISVLSKCANNAYKAYERIRLISLCLTTLSIMKNHRVKPIKVLKTDLWNEGVERARNVISVINNIFCKKILFYGIDISRYVVKEAKDKLKYISAVQSSITHIPFRNGFFDIIFDLSTIDHVPYKYRRNIVREYFRCLKPEGLLLLVIDTINIYTKLAKTLSSKKISRLLTHSEDSLPEFPNTIRANVEEFFDIIQEGYIDIAYPIFRFVFSGRKSRVFRVLLDKMHISRILYSVENSSITRKMSFLYRQLFLICRRK